MIIMYMPLIIVIMMMLAVIMTKIKSLKLIDIPQNAIVARRDRSIGGAQYRHIP